MVCKIEWGTEKNGEKIPRPRKKLRRLLLENAFFVQFCMVIVSIILYIII